MLSPSVITIVKNSAPILASEGENITRRFYRILFEKYPQLKHTFNLSNQRNGNQARALADAIFAYAEMIEHPQRLLPMVNRIAHKHVSLNILPEHYPMVGEALLTALSEQLSLPMQHEVILAWGEAYNVLADIFIHHEESLYLQAEDALGGWRGFRPFVVTQIDQETPLIKSFYLKPADGDGLPLFKAGQYVGVTLDLVDHPLDEIRQYSLSDSPGQDHYRISVKAEPGNPKGVVSNYLHERIDVGDQIKLSVPCGDFVLPDTRTTETVLISGGVGITPMMSMLKTCLEDSAGPMPTFIHCAQSAQHQCFDEELQSLQQQYGFSAYRAYLEGEEGDHLGYLNQGVLDRWLPRVEADYYFCGPLPFMVALRHLLIERGVAPQRIHYEVFGPTQKLAA